MTRLVSLIAAAVLALATLAAGQQSAPSTTQGPSTTQNPSTKNTSNAPQPRASAKSPSAEQKNVSAPFLPNTFAGWEKKSDRFSTDVAVADPTNPAVLKEYGLQAVEIASYQQGDGRTLQLKAARFADASGSYGAFTFYKTPAMETEKIGDQGSYAENRVLFYAGSVLVDAKFDRLTAMSAAELRELASALPRPAGSAANLPVLPAYLPKRDYVKNSAKYVEGPAGLAAVDSPVAADKIDFSRGAEVALGEYATPEGNATMVLVSYPTPQIAGEKLKSFQATSSNVPFFTKRSGPLVAIVTGPIAQSGARGLLSQVNYDADITWDQKVFTRKDNVGNLLINVVLLISILVVISLAVGLAFGGLRILTKRYFPDKVFDRTQDIEIIQLNLSGERRA